MHRTGIYEGVFVTFQRQSYFPYKPAGASPRPTLRTTKQPSPPSVEGGDFRRKSEGVFKENNEDHEVVVGEFQRQSYFPTNTDAHSAPLRVCVNRNKASLV